MAGDKRPDDPQTEAQAAAWLARMRSDDRTEVDGAAFQVWLAESERNRRTFYLLTNAWEAAGRAGAPSSSPSRPRSPSKVDRRMILTGSAMVAATAGLGGFWAAAPPKIFNTRFGEQRRVELEDGSVLLLDTDTEIRVAMGHTRRAEVVRGRGHFQVAKDPSRPFLVDMDRYHVLVTGTDFDIARDDLIRSVVLVEGSVIVDGMDHAGRMLHRVLIPGERLMFKGADLDRDDRPNLAAVTAWQNGRMILDDQPLAYAIAEINKYHRRKLAAPDPAVAQMRLSGVYQIDDPDGFAVSVSNLLPVEVEAKDDQLVLRARP